MKKIIVFSIALFIGSAFVYTQAQGKGKGKGREKQATEQKQTQLEKAEEMMLPEETEDNEQSDQAEANQATE